MELCPAESFSQLLDGFYGKRDQQDRIQQKTQALQFLLLLRLQSLQLLLLERVSAAPRGLSRTRGAQNCHLLHTMEERRDRE